VHSLSEGASQKNRNYACWISGLYFPIPDLSLG
jgi:hypothetical protein